MKIVFMGTSDFAVNILSVLYEKSQHNILAVVTQPDRAKGRYSKLAGSAVKEYSLKNNIRIFQPEHVKSEDFVKVLRELDPDIVVVAAYGQILSQEILELPRFGCINVHGSLLPKYRGAAPAQYAIWCGEKLSGVTIMQMDKGMDTGAVYDRVSLPIDENMTSGELLDALAKVGATSLLFTLDRIADGKAEVKFQNDNYATYAKMINREMEKIEWQEDGLSVHNKVRAFNPTPGAYAILPNGSEIKIWRTEYVDESGQPGQVLSIDKKGFVVACGKKAIRILEVQVAGKKRMDARAFINGRGIAVGNILQ